MIRPKKGQVSPHRTDVRTTSDAESLVTEPEVTTTTLQGSHGTPAGKLPPLKKEVCTLSTVIFLVITSDSYQLFVYLRCFRMVLVEATKQWNTKPEDAFRTIIKESLRRHL